MWCRLWPRLRHNWSPDICRSWWRLQTRNDILLRRSRCRRLRNGASADKLQAQLVRMHNTHGFIAVIGAILVVPSASVEFRASDDDNATNTYSNTSAADAHTATLHPAATTTPCPTPATSAATAATSTTCRPQLRSGSPKYVDSTEKGLVLCPPPHRLSSNTTTTTTTDADFQAAATTAPSADNRTSPSSDNTPPSPDRYHILPIRLQCWLLELAKGLARR